MSHVNQQAFFAQRLRVLRMSRQLSQTTLAQQVGIGQDTLSDYECGKTCPTHDTVWRIAQTLNVDITYFFMDQPLAPLSEQDRETLALVLTLPPTALGYILRLIQALIVLQQHRYFLPSLADTLMPETQQSRLNVLKNEWQTFETNLTTAPPHGCPFLHTLVEYTARLVMTLETPHPKLDTKDVIRCLRASSQKLLQILNRSCGDEERG